MSLEDASAACRHCGGGGGGREETKMTSTLSSLFGFFFFFPLSKANVPNLKVAWQKKLCFW